MGNTINDRLHAAAGRPSGFDYMRIILAFLVIANHAPMVAYGGKYGADTVWHLPLLPASRLILPMFFALSGFLVAGSFERCRTMVSFFGLRVIRIVPALAVETFISALILGPIFTNMTLSAYVADPLFARYFLNILGEPQYFLPGVFTDNLVPEVNRQLWTIPFELGCYAALGFLALMGANRHKWLAPVGCVAIAVFSLTARLTFKGGMPDVHQAVPGEMLIATFLAGVAVYQYRDRIPSGNAFIVVLALVSAITVTLPGYWILFSPLPVALLTILIGIRNPKRGRLIAGADYSYGVFLYGFPLQQALIALFPAYAGLGLSLIAASVIAYGLAAMSWHWIEKPAMSLRHQVKNIENRWLRLRSRIPFARSNVCET